MKGTLYNVFLTFVTDDMDNQAACRIAKEYDPSGKRTIGTRNPRLKLKWGVLTKPDTVAEGDHESWLNVYNGSSVSPHHKYYIVRLSTSKEMSLEWSEYREIERKFFSGRPWNQLRDKKRLGIANLREKLSGMLSERMDETCAIRSSLLTGSFPHLKPMLSGRLKDVQRGISSLPKWSTDDPQLELLKLCGNYTSAVRNYTSGNNHNGVRCTFIDDCWECYHQLKNAIMETEPHFEQSYSNLEVTSVQGRGEKRPKESTESITRIASITDTIRNFSRRCVENYWPEV